jgi:hypothetical protein
MIFKKAVSLGKEPLKKTGFYCAFLYILEIELKVKENIPRFEEINHKTVLVS